MANVLSRLSKSSGSRTQRPSSQQDLERALDKAGDARDLAKDVLRALPDAETGEEEVTARHDAPSMPSIHVHMHSEHDAEDTEPAKKQVKTALIALGTGVGLALLGGLATLLQRCGH